MVSAAIFLGLSVVLIASLQSTRKMETKSDANSQAYRKAQTVMAHLASELRGSQLVEPVDLDVGANTIVYRKPQLNGDRLKINAFGEPLWEDPTSITADPTNQVMQTRSDGSLRVLAELGADGRLSFVRYREDTIKVTVEATVLDPGNRVLREGRSRSERLFYFANQP